VCGGIGTTGLSSGVSSSLAHVDPPQSFLRVSRFCRLFLVLPLLILSAKTYADPVVLDCLRLRSGFGEPLRIDRVVIDSINMTITGPATCPVAIKHWDKQSLYWQFQEWHYLLNLKTRFLKSFRPSVNGLNWASTPDAVRRCSRSR
jgi:hypothetical protein